MIPIIFIHNQNSNYLPLSLWQARHSNPQNDIILIGDSYNAHFKYMVNHVDKKDYSHGANEFAKRFTNFSTNSHEFELICLQRWFILEEFLILNGFTQCLYLDSDILLFGDVNEDARRFSTFGMTISGISGHSNYISKTETLSKFCQFIRDSYDGPEAIQILEQKYLEFRKTHEAGGISDMTFFVEFREMHPDLVLDISQPIHEKLYDISMNYIEGFENWKGLKVIKAGKNRRAYIREEETRKMLQIQTLHFQGETKSEMRRHVFSGTRALSFIVSLNNLIILGQKIWKRLKSKT